jgi:hypothetical protein
MLRTYPSLHSHGLVPCQDRPTYLYLLIPEFWAGWNPVHQVVAQSVRKNKARGTRSLGKSLPGMHSLLSSIIFVAEVSSDAAIAGSMTSKMTYESESCFRANNKSLSTIPC